MVNTIDSQSVFIFSQNYKRFMSRKDLANPFLQKKLNLSMTSSLLSYGDDSFSMYKMLKKNSRLSQSSVVDSQRSMEEEILWKYQKQYYEVDSEGHSLAQESITEEIFKQKPKTDDFWLKVQALSAKRNNNPFSKITTKDQIQTASHFTSSSFQTLQDRSKKSTLFDSKKSDRRQKCKEAMKLRHFIESKKVLQTENNQAQQKFSLLKMYKGKQDSQPLHASKRQSRKSVKYEYPQSVFIQGMQYFRVPLE